MTTTQHTPGPWIYVPDENISGHREPDRVEAGTYEITQRNKKYGGIYISDTTTANARLIAAAPDLLEALKSSQQFLVAWQIEYSGKEKTKHNTAQLQLIMDALDRNTAAIAKAEGR